MSRRYVHTLLFRCDTCQLPLVVTHISDQGNPEGIDKQSVIVKCGVCFNSFEVLAVTARRHYVEEWDSIKGLSSK